MEPVAKIKNLSVAFSDRLALNDVNFTLPSREITVLIGPSGSGKTTFLRAINRMNELYHGCTTTGSLEFKLNGKWIDILVDTLNLADLRRRAAMVFQTPYVLPLSIKKNFTVPLKLTLHLRKAEIRERMERALQDADLFEEVKDRLHENALHLSGGQQQRLCLARALAMNPDLLLLDEPTASLDFRATRKIEKLLLDLKARYTIVAVSHSLGQTSRIADRSIILREGRIAEVVDRTQLHDPNRLQKIVEEIF